MVYGLQGVSEGVLEGVSSFGSRAVRVQNSVFPCFGSA